MSNWIVQHAWEIAGLVFSGIGVLFSILDRLAAVDAKEAARDARNQFFTRSIADELNNCTQSINNVWLHVRNEDYSAASAEARRVLSLLAEIRSRSSPRLEDVASDLQTAQQQVRDIVSAVSSNELKPREKKQLDQDLGDVLESLSKTVGAIKSKLDDG